MSSSVDAICEEGRVGVVKGALERLDLRLLSKSVLGIPQGLRAASAATIP
ncbi:hypothetical protein EGR_07191 [Echinococcus granulosus]|uniref:Uncharacterized protein n=1 Tax=Echinococcus granulosus TaxID=6210 RepID=W6UBH6_ECHGR|nr:hypothetical protein EGR_07191 [Echinococcus granulosus]EUB57921.1 hypothetical protein EGR_07191 [Echinococcus granulosus]